MFIPASEATGHLISLLKTDPRHLSGSQADQKVTPKPVESFGQLFNNALGAVNNLQIDSMALSQQMITDPDSVDVHDITIAMAEANLSLSMTKAIVDQAVKAYREIISLR